MLVGQEEVAVDHRGFQHRDLQATDDEFHLDRDGLVGKHEVKHLGQRVHRAAVQLRRAAHLLAVAHLAQHVVFADVLAFDPGPHDGGFGAGLQATEVTHKGRIGRNTRHGCVAGCAAAPFTTATATATA